MLEAARAHEVWARPKRPDSALICDHLRLEPEGPAGAYRGKAVFVAPTGEPAEPIFELDYEGSPPLLTEPRARIADETLSLECVRVTREGVEKRGEWFLTEDACRGASAAAPLAPSGCPDALEPAVRERARRIATGVVRDSFVRAVAAKREIWRGPTCTHLFVRKRKKDVRLDDPHAAYPLSFAPRGHMLVAVDELPEANPHRVREPGLGSITSDCCEKETFEVLDVESDVAVLRSRPNPDDPNGRAPREQRWYFTRAACTKGLAREGPL